MVLPRHLDRRFSVRRFQKSIAGVPQQGYQEVPLLGDIIHHKNNLSRYRHGGKGKRKDGE